MKRLNGKVALITGASSPRGMGFATAMKLASEGASIIVTDIEPARTNLNIAVEKIKKIGTEVSSCLVDITKENQVQACIEKTIEMFGKIDILFNNAGVGQVGPFEETDLSTWDINYQVNVRGTAACIKSVLPFMKKNGGGSIINNASIGGIYADPGYAPYNSSKFAVVGLTKALALEFGQYNIRVNAICPGFVNTEMGDKIPAYYAEKEGCTVAEMRESFKSTIALGEYAEPNQIADAVLFLASAESQYITGITLPVAGGYPQAL
jgi:NAD(P)-dependent dehydrogenase (short-subunit alcohol dehydrogenase family)